MSFAKVAFVAALAAGPVAPAFPERVGLRKSGLLLPVARWRRQAFCAAWRSSDGRRASSGRDRRVQGTLLRALGGQTPEDQQETPVAAGPRFAAAGAASMGLVAMALLAARALPDDVGGARALPVLAAFLASAALVREARASLLRAKRELGSDFLEQNLGRASGPSFDAGCAEAGRVQLVSLGSYCGPKATFRSMGRGSAHLPFDWVRTRLDGLLGFIRSDFDGFFDFDDGPLEVPGRSWQLYRSRMHSFWHDDPRSEAMRAKYRRRIARFQSLDATAGPILFVRAAADAQEELERAPELLRELEARCGKDIRLLLILDFQRSINGPFTVEGIPELLVYCQTEGEIGPVDNPYQRPLLCGLEWIAGRPVGTQHFASLEKASQATDVACVTEAYGVEVFQPAPGEHAA